jgi:hypothetical protein
MKKAPCSAFFCALALPPGKRKAAAPFDAAANLLG